MVFLRYDNLVSIGVTWGEENVVRKLLSEIIVMIRIHFIFVFILKTI